MLEHHSQREPNFVEKRRQWKAGMEKPMSRRSLLAIMPALALSVFALLSAPYLDDLLKMFSKKGEEYQVNEISLKDEPKPEEIVLPPQDPERGLTEFYREQFDKDGFDWRQKPEIEGPDLSYARELDIEVKPVEVELPATMSELARQSRNTESTEAK